MSTSWSFAPARVAGGLVPLSLKAGHPLSDMTPTKILRDAGRADRATVHSFRASFRIWALEQTDAPGRSPRPLWPTASEAQPSRPASGATPTPSAATSWTSGRSTWSARAVGVAVKGRPAAEPAAAAGSGLDGRLRAVTWTGSDSAVGLIGVGADEVRISPMVLQDKQLRFSGSDIATLTVGPGPVAKGQCSVRRALFWSPKQRGTNRAHTGYCCVDSD